MLVLKGQEIFSSGRILRDHMLIIQDGIIETIEPQGSIRIPDNAELIDTGTDLIAPGFIDLQLNGGFGMDFTQDPGTIWKTARQVPQYGVTTFLPTIITSPFTTIFSAMQAIQEVPGGFSGAMPMGLHLEGPFLSREKKGAHNPDLLVPAWLDDVAQWFPENGVSMVTLAPEIPGALDVIRELTSRGIIVSAGHSNARYIEAVGGIEAGIRYGTHLFNAMSSLQHRDPGLPGALLTHDSVFTGVIADGIHTHPAIVDLIWRIKGAGGMTLVSDAMAALGMPPGKYALGVADEVTVDETSARLTDGTLAGSILSPDQALRNLMTYTGCTLTEALPTLTQTPANVLNLVNRGDLKPGYIADLTVLDKRGNVRKTIAAGKIVYQF